ncbi:MAG: hypothetical protein V2G42_04500 [bacterium JZ-2024 1]
MNDPGFSIAWQEMNHILLTATVGTPHLAGEGLDTKRGSAPRAGQSNEPGRIPLDT